uniref:Uncharacterized protein n=1 Tax=Amphora coffeiformis TaxID=265554 RepID=A0A7S3L6A4_9STRA|mmetsp:Transcript_6057/g.12490  ORF Transcript_6057/g.12490 Transcript_6057/m.12490 type:complete len:365 (-) Transcript_6057:535-1629(-)
MSFIDDESPDTYYYNDESLDDVEGGSSSPYYFDDELEQAHAEEHATGWSSSEDENDSYGQDSFHNIEKHNNPPALNRPLHRYPIHAGEGDIGAVELPKPALVQKQPSQATSMMPPSEYAARRATERQRRIPNCCESRTQRLRCIGGTLSAAGIFTLGFMLVLLGNMWYEKYNPSEDDSSPDTPQWQIVEVVTHVPDETLAPTETEGSDAPIDDKSTNMTDMPTLTPITAPQLYILHETLGDQMQLELQLGGSSKTVYSTLESTDSFSCTKARDSLLLHLPGMATITSSAATVSSIALQLDLTEDVSIVVCDEDEIEVVYHHVFLDSADNTENVTEVRLDCCTSIVCNQPCISPLPKPIRFLGPP